MKYFWLISGIVAADIKYTWNYPTIPDKVPEVNAAFVNAFDPQISNLTNGPPITFEKYGCNQVNEWALTFDDGPGPSTISVLDELKSRNLKATFFVKGQQAIRYPEILKRIFKEGHEIGIHTWSHPQLFTLKNSQVITEAMYTHQIIKDILGVSCKYFRPPFGSSDNRVRGVLELMGFVVVRWNRDTKDWSGPVLKANMDRWIAEPITHGSISLEHDLFPDAASQAPYAMNVLQKSKYALRTVSQCIGITPYGELNYKRALVANETIKPVTFPSIAVPTGVAFATTITWGVAHTKTATATVQAAKTSVNEIPSPAPAPTSYGKNYGTITQVPTFLFPLLALICL
ncbi:hypothetical protein BC833DRAFT_597607 [Globomyces pollinis-pini]|nr:hypothetical protein BC833DRAFT_597607 [Globomyces pollinis-pini]